MRENALAPLWVNSGLHPISTRSTGNLVAILALCLIPVISGCSTLGDMAAGTSTPNARLQRLALGTLSLESTD
jgi:hypothetical protein